MTFVVTAAMALAVSVGAPIGSGAPQPCSGLYGSVAVSSDPTIYGNYDTNQNGIVCATKTLSSIKDDYVGKKP